MNLRVTSVLLLALGATASADVPNKVSLTGADARALTLGLKLAGVASTKAGGTVSYSVTKVTCTSTDGNVTEDGLSVTSCEAGTAKPTAAQAAVLNNALVSTLGSKGLPSDDHMSKTTVTVGSIACTIGPDAKAGKSVDRFSCDIGLRDPKKRATKDLVQPVHIEKQ